MSPLARDDHTKGLRRRSAGIIAYQLLTGRLPFSGDSGEEVAELYMQKQLFQNRVRSCCLLIALQHGDGALTDLIPLPKQHHGRAVEAVCVFICQMSCAMQR